MKPKPLIIVSLIGLTAILTSAALRQGSGGPIQLGGDELYESASVHLRCPDGQTPTTPQIIAAMSGYAKGALPQGWTVVDGKGHVRARFTGIVDHVTGDKQMVVVVSDDVADLDQAWLYVNGSVVFHATYANGAIIERNGYSIASLTTFVPASLPNSMEVKWSSQTSVLQSEWISK